MVKAARATASRLLICLAYRDYRAMWMATMAAGASTWALIVARGTLVFTMSGSSTMVGVVTFAAMGPDFIVPLFAGFLADLFDRRKLLAWIFGIQLFQTLALAGLALTGTIQIWHIVVLSVINGVGRAALTPTADSLVPNLVPRDKLLNAVALNVATHHASRLVGPLLIAPVLATIGISWAFAMCAGLYAVGLVMVVRVRTISTGVIERDKGILRNVLAGAEYIYHHRLLLSVLILVVLHCSLTMAFESMLPVLSREKLGTGEAGFAYIMMAVGAGGLLVVSILASIQNERMRWRLYLWLGVLSGIGPIALAASALLPMAFLSAAVMGGAQAGFMTLTVVLVQSIVPDSIRGRASSIYSVHIGGMMAVFNLVNGTMADVFNAPLVLTVGGLIFVIVMAISWLRAPLRALYVSGPRAETQSQAS
jgi:MFS family permease